MTAAPAIDVRRSTKDHEMGHGTDPLWSASDLPTKVGVKRGRLKETRRQQREPAGLTLAAATSPAADRQRAQLPPFAPLLEELEVAGWSSNQPLLHANFHDWMSLSGNRLLVLAGCVAIAGSADPIDAQLSSQAAWAAIRAHAAHASDAGDILTLASRTLWSVPAAPSASLAVALVDTTGGSISVALAGDCLAWRVRAAICERLAIHHPPLGTATSVCYQSQSYRLALRERLVLVADDALTRSPKAESALAARFSHLDAESHRRMAAADAVALVRKIYASRDCDATQSISIAAIRRR